MPDGSVPIARYVRELTEGMMTEITEERAERIKGFTEAMLEKLNRPKNVAKGDWRDMDPRVLYDRLCEEVEELKQAQSPEEIIEEAIDVANFAFMFWDIVS